MSLVRLDGSELIVDPFGMGSMEEEEIERERERERENQKKGKKLTFKEPQANSLVNIVQPMDWTLQPPYFVI